MADVDLFQLKPGAVIELERREVALEKSLKDIFDVNLDALLGVRFLASEFRTTNRGRMHNPNEGGEVIDWESKEAKELSNLFLHRVKQIEAEGGGR